MLVERDHPLLGEAAQQLRREEGGAQRALLEAQGRPRFEARAQRGSMPMVRFMPVGRSRVGATCLMPSTTHLMPSAPHSRGLQRLAHINQERRRVRGVEAVLAAA